MAASSSTGWELKPDYPLVVRVTTATIKRTFFGKKNNPPKNKQKRKNERKKKQPKNITSAKAHKGDKNDRKAQKSCTFF